MAKDISFMQYMRAHGNTAGPTQRPLLTGAISGLLAFVPYEAVLRLSGGRASIAAGFDINMWTSTAINMVVMVLAGMIYAAIFKRAANDCRGGWIFGASYGFVLWMIAPITMWQLLGSRELAVGTAAMGLFGAHVLFGLALGTVFPWIHFLIQSRLSNINDQRMQMGQSEQGGK
ncbi:MAG TPA: hypothetical protein VFZ23_08320 [Pyrinomonadaceae bacterium]